MNQQNVAHPKGCMCQNCIDEREMEDDEEGVQQPVAPPVQTAPRPRGRPRKNPPQGRPVYPESYTQPVEPPRDHHARYEYERGELRRCHLCGTHESHMNFDNGDEPVWFASLEDRARHILEIHTDAADPIIKMERQRAKEILGIKDVWDRHSEGKPIMLGKPQMDEFVSSPTSNYPTQPKKSLLGGLLGGGEKKPKVQGGGNWFSQHKLMAAILVIAILYGLYMMYLISQGYSF